MTESSTQPSPPPFARDPDAPRVVAAEVVSAEWLTPRWRRLVIDTKEGYQYLKPHFEVEDGLAAAFHMAFFFPVTKEKAENWPRISGAFAQFFDVDPGLYNDPDVELCSRRMYTVRPVDGDLQQLEMNFAIHGDGLAMEWSQEAKPGSLLLMDMGARVVDVDHFPIKNNYVLLGDETSFPSIATMLERLPSTAKISICLEAGDADDEWTFPEHPNAEITWVHRGDQAPGTTSFMIDYCQQFDFPADGDFHVWAACEGGQIYKLRKFLRGELKMQRGQYELMGYWRRGVRTEKLLEVESDHVNARLAQGLTPFERDPDDDQPTKTPLERIDIDGSELGVPGLDE